MIGKLQRKFIVMVLAGLFVLLSVIVLAINCVSWAFVEQKNESVLQLLSETGGRRPGQRNSVEQHKPPTPYVHGDTLEDDRNVAANMSNYYVVRLNDDGSVRHWSSDRQELYSDQQIAETAAEALASGEEKGRIGSQFWRMTKRKEGHLLVVLDARMEVENAQNMAQTTIWVGILAYLVMGAGAIMLIRRMTRPVETAFEKQKQFVWDASHELKTPLAVISANAEVLAGEIGENEWLGYIQSEVRRTDKLVQNLLTLARLDRDGLPVKQQKLDLSQAILQVALPFESTVFEAGKTMHLQVPENITCVGDSAMLQQLVVILLSNAVKYSDPKGHITLMLESKGDRCILQVHNTGEPIAAQAMPYLFDRFYRGDSSHNGDNPGNGLGLAIAQTIVRAHKGKISVESTEKEGTCFTVII